MPSSCPRPCRMRALRGPRPSSNPDHRGSAASTLPMFREALMLHYLDDLDSKMAAVRAALASDKGEGNWTAFSGALERRFLRVDLFRRAEESAAKNTSSRNA